MGVGSFQGPVPDFSRAGLYHSQLSHEQGPVRKADRNKAGHSKARREFDAIFSQPGTPLERLAKAVAFRFSKTRGTTALQPRIDRIVSRVRAANGLVPNNVGGWGRPAVVPPGRHALFAGYADAVRRKMAIASPKGFRNHCLKTVDRHDRRAKSKGLTQWAVEIALLLHAQHKLFLSRFATIQFGPPETIAVTPYSKKYHNSYGPTRVICAGVRLEWRADGEYIIFYPTGRAPFEYRTDDDVIKHLATKIIANKILST